jgi:exopolyphosphatase / guanosine-5'-triphosphate,3'-diphosphate pyrophosphatase
MLFASIDIGTNAARLLFSNVHEKNETAVAHKVSLIRIPLRLGDDVFQNKRIGEEKQMELIKTITAFKLMIEVFNPLAFVACASSAMREAQNAPEIIERIKKETGVDLRVISGLEEAAIITSAHKSPMGKNQKYKMFVDLGGGSTEISMLKNNEIVKSRSFDIGTIRFIHDKIHEQEWNKLESWLSEFKNDFNKIMMIGAGGNINKLAKMYGLKEKKYITLNELKKAKKHLSHYTFQERIDLLGIRPDRADVILPAGMIFIRIMKMIKAKKISVPGIGLADGLIYKVYNEYIQNI